MAIIAAEAQEAAAARSVESDSRRSDISGASFGDSLSDGPDVALEIASVWWFRVRVAGSGLLIVPGWIGIVLVFVFF